MALYRSVCELAHGGAEICEENMQGLPMFFAVIQPLQKIVHQRLHGIFINCVKTAIMHVA